MRVALIGQPNCGKSTLFNHVAGYRSATANYPGTTVRLASSQVRLNGHVIDRIDVPGIYSLNTSNPSEDAARRSAGESSHRCAAAAADGARFPRGTYGGDLCPLTKAKGSGTLPA